MTRISCFWNLRLNLKLVRLSIDISFIEFWKENSHFVHALQSIILFIWNTPYRALAKLSFIEFVLLTLSSSFQLGFKSLKFLFKMHKTLIVSLVLLSPCHLLFQNFDLLPNQIDFHSLYNFILVHIIRCIRSVSKKYLIKNILFHFECLFKEKFVLLHPTVLIPITFFLLLQCWFIWGEIIVQVLWKFHWLVIFSYKLLCYK